MEKFKLKRSPKGLPEVIVELPVSLLIKMKELHPNNYKQLLKKLLDDQEAMAIQQRDSNR